MKGSCLCGTIECEDKIRRKTQRSRGDSMETIVKDLNPMLKGWFNYFKQAHKWTFSTIDCLIRRRGLFTMKEAHAMVSSFPYPYRFPITPAFAE